MNNILFWLWFADTSHALNIILAIMGSILLLGAVIAGFSIFLYREELGPADYQKGQHGSKIVIIISVLAILLACCLPSKQTIYIYLGLDTASDLVEKLTDSSVGKKTLLLLEQKIDEELKVEDKTEDE